MPRHQFGFTHDENEALEVIVVVTASLSVIGAAFIILSYAAWKDIRSSSRKLIVCLSICDLITAAFNGIGVLLGADQLAHKEPDGTYGSPTALCVAQSVLNTYSSVGSFFWTTAVAVFLYINLVHSSTRAERAIPFMHIICWGVPASVVLVALRFAVLGYDPNVTVGWCWLRSSKDVTHLPFWRLITGKAWEMAAYLIVPIMYALVKLKMTADNKLLPESQALLTKSARQSVREADRKLVIVPLVFVFLRVWGTIRFFLDWKYDGSDRPEFYWLAVLQAFGDSGQGFANFILFVICTKRVRDHLCCFTRKPKDASINDITRFTNTAMHMHSEE